MGVDPGESTNPHALHTRGRIDDAELETLLALEELRNGRVVRAVADWLRRRAQRQRRPIEEPAMDDSVRDAAERVEGEVDLREVKDLTGWSDDGRTREAYVDLAEALEREGL